MNLPGDRSWHGLSGLKVEAGMLALVALGWLACGCGNSESDGLFPTAPVGELAGIVSCGDKVSLGASGTPSDQDCIKYDYKRRVLSLKHINAAFNCCPDIEAGVTVRGDTILVTEHERQGGCHCLCLYDLEYEVRGLPPGAYRVIVAEEYLAEGDEPLDFAIDLTASPSGKHCVTRSHYPWEE